MPYCWYLMGIGDFVSSGISIHLCWGKYLSRCGKTAAMWSHLSGLTWSRSQRSTREACSFLATSFHKSSLRLHTLAMSSTVSLFFALAGLVPSARVQRVSCSFLSGKRKMGVALARDPEPFTTSTSS